MNIPRPSQFRRERGSILAIALITGGIIGLTLVSYLDLVSAQHRSVMRSQDWNSVLPVCEAGVEEAMAHLNKVGANDRGVNGWALVNNEYSLARAPFSDTNLWYQVSVSTNDPPVITSVGYAYIPLRNKTILRSVRVTTTRASTGSTGLVAKDDIELGTLSTVDSFDSRITPTYTFLGLRSNAFVGAVDGSITSGSLIKGSAATGPDGRVETPVTGTVASDLNLDFPDVTNPTNTGWVAIPENVTVITTNYAGATNTYSTNVYPVSVPSNSTIATNYVVSTNTVPPATNVAYSAYTGTSNSTAWPGAGYSVTTNTTYLTNQASVPISGTYLIPPGIATNAGSIYTNITITEKGNSGNFTTNYTVVSGTNGYTYYRIDGYTYTVTNYIVTNPVFMVTSISNNPVLSTNSYGYGLGNGNYYATSQIRMSGSDEMVVYGDAVLWAKGGIVLSGNAQLSILPGASLTIYVGDANSTTAVEATFNGNGVVNMGGDTAKMSYFGLPNNTEVTLNGNAGFTGTVYAPQATLCSNGGGRDNYDMVGAVIVDKVRFTGHVNFHYDEKLGDNSAVTQWNVGSWTEF